MGTPQGGGAGAAVSVGRPGYLLLAESGELAARVKRAEELLSACILCPRRCGINRLVGELGYCRAGADPVVASWNVHIWEEPPISGTRGSGTVFFSHCTARCRFCQNYPISQLGVGTEVSAGRLAEMMAELQGKGCHNINFVSPTHFAAQIVLALPRAIELGLRIPLVYNTSGYDSLETLHLLDGIVDIYLPDAKYASNDMARRLGGFKGYVEADRAALKEMFRQVGDSLVLDDNGIAERGMIIRHLVLPGGLAQSEEVFNWIARELSPDVHVDIMAQYFPAHRVLNDPVLGRKVSPDEYIAAIEAFERAGLQNGWFQEQDEACEGWYDARTRTEEDSVKATEKSVALPTFRQDAPLAWAAVCGAVSVIGLRWNWMALGLVLAAVVLLELVCRWVPWLLAQDVLLHAEDSEAEARPATLPYTLPNSPAQRAAERFVRAGRAWSTFLTQPEGLRARLLVLLILAGLLLFYGMGAPAMWVGLLSVAAAILCGYWLRTSAMAASVCAAMSLTSLAWILGALVGGGGWSLRLTAAIAFGIAAGGLEALRCGKGWGKGLLRLGLVASAVVLVVYRFALPALAVLFTAAPALALFTPNTEAYDELARTARPLVLICMAVVALSLGW